MAFSHSLFLMDFVELYSLKHEKKIYEPNDNYKPI